MKTKSHKRYIAICLTALNLLSFNSARAQEESKFLVLPAGTTFEGRMDATIGSAASQSGQRFTITIASPVLANGVDVLIAAGSQILGEVVEAIPSSTIPHQKETPPHLGKLRIQLNALRTTDGITYPLVASLASDAGRDSASYNQAGGVGYVGGSENFEAVAPGKRNDRRGNYGQPQVATREEILRDPIYGMDRQNQRQGGQIRSLTRRGYDLFIDGGAPITIKLGAPFRVSLNRPNLDVPINAPSNAPSNAIDSSQSSSQSSESSSSTSTSTGSITSSTSSSSKTSNKSETSTSYGGMPQDMGTAGGAEPPMDIIRSRGSSHKERQESETQTHSEESRETRTIETPF